MSQIINWLCYICVNCLVLEIIIYLCKDIIKISKNKTIKKSRSVGKSRVNLNEHIYTNKIAK